MRRSRRAAEGAERAFQRPNTAVELIVLGSGTVAPSPERTAPAYWVSTGAVRLLMDCGAGTMHRMAGLGLPWPTITHVAITHFHMDHWGELPMLLFAMRYGTQPARTAPLQLVGPPGFHTRLSLLAAALGDWVLEPGFPLEITELRPDAALELSTGVTLEASKTPHTPESLAYAVRDPSGRLVYTGDTGSSESLARWARPCDLLVAECSLPDSLAMDIHLTPTRAGELAQAAGARRLVLTHFYPQVEGTDPAAAAARVFLGPVTAARDGDRFVIEDTAC